MAFDLEAIRADLERLRVERDRAIAEVVRVRKVYATPDAYEAACAAIREAERKRDEARDVVDTCHEYSLGLARELGDARAEAAQNLANVRAMDDLRMREIKDLRHALDRAGEAMPEDVDPEAELETQIRALVATIAETRAVAAEDIARAIEAGTPDPDPVMAGLVTMACRNQRDKDARIARLHATVPADGEGTAT